MENDLAKLEGEGGQHGEGDQFQDYGMDADDGGGDEDQVW